ncbi:meiotically up-regulated gene 56 protein [Pseudovirgaria hyperparasitica]|uniref:Meiotically up-regulated gene 56 protein n=1 Tax=Pseudovirgaria hyperparasitica TaxID=470096 RepID=A0A6A6VSL9_9PEZI|nr:meiotically up-regulated gene 56 protein [Pseudovirgaria hyperparasitica]KAF2752869.1 meiotically up-regulated gene 56 protein [Pseudovirgaria hyperparasitica]
MLDREEERPRPHHQYSQVYGLPADSHTAHRLRHATPQHLHQTTRRCFIGPIPEGWLKSHKHDWYKHRLHSSHSSRAVLSQASTHHSKHRRLSGLDGPSTTALYGHSFPPPDDLEAEEEMHLDGTALSQPLSTEAQSALGIPRTSSPSTLKHPDNEETDQIEQTSDVLPPRPPFLSMRSSSSRIRTLREVGKTRTKSGDSFVTANESLRELTPGFSVDDEEENTAITNNETRIPESGPSSRSQGSPNLRPTSTLETDPSKQNSFSEAPGDAMSTSHLIQGKDQDELLDNAEGSSGKRGEVKGILSRAKSKLQSRSDDSEDGHTPRETLKRQRSSLRALVHFEVPEESKRAELQLRARAAQLSIQRASTKLRRSRAKDGQIIKMERMLVRVDMTTHNLPDEFDENEIQKVEARTTEKWREYMVVCRQSTSDDAEFVLQMYKSRVIPEIEGTKAPKRTKHQIPLGRKISKVNLFSSLDKTIVVWVPSKKGTTTFYIMQTQSSSNAVEWYTFLRNILGWSRAEEIQVTVPDMSVSLMLQNPFERIEASRDAVRAVEGSDEAIVRTMREEQAVAGNIIQRSLAMLKHNPEWDNIMKAWEKERIGLCWKRYDRLEWIHGENERKMYGTIAMMKSHELELRPKQHYPTAIHDHTKGERIIEPPPVEGFLIRLTSQRGASKRLGKTFFKKLYYSTFDQYLAFSNPVHAYPPPPPKLPTADGTRPPSSRQITETMPLIYTVNPYPVKAGEIDWLSDGHIEMTEERNLRDQDALEEHERKLNFLFRCQGFINLCNVERVRKFKMGATSADEALDDDGSDVDFDQNDRSNSRYDGTTNSIDDKRTFELVMSNGLVVRLQAYDEETKREWIIRLRDLVYYWKKRMAADILLLKNVRQQNLEDLKIDEEAEAFVGQFARKWEVTHSYASPELYNLCGISRCRTIHLSGMLYRKPRRHATFSRCSVLLVSGRLLVFQDTLRERSGRVIPHIHQERITSLDLKDCYLYSGLLTESDLLYQNRTFDSSKPGHHALPRIYLEDGWTSTDEDVMTCFVIWHGKRKAWFRSEDHDEETGEGKRSKLKLVSRLGVTGRSLVFRARSRAERDHWVLGIQNEIERLREQEDFRIEDKKSD